MLLSWQIPLLTCTPKSDIGCEIGQRYLTWPAFTVKYRYRRRNEHGQWRKIYLLCTKLTTSGRFNICLPAIDLYVTSTPSESPSQFRLVTPSFRMRNLHARTISNASAAFRSRLQAFEDGKSMAWLNVIDSKTKPHKLHSLTGGLILVSLLSKPYRRCPWTGGGRDVFVHVLISVIIQTLQQFATRFRNGFIIIKLRWRGLVAYSRSTAAAEPDIKAWQLLQLIQCSRGRLWLQKYRHAAAPTQRCPACPQLCSWTRMHGTPRWYLQSGSAAGTEMAQTPLRPHLQAPASAHGHDLMLTPPCTWRQCLCLSSCARPTRNATSRCALHCLQFIPPSGWAPCWLQLVTFLVSNSECPSCVIILYPSSH